MNAFGDDAGNGITEDVLRIQLCYPPNLIDFLLLQLVL